MKHTGLLGHLKHQFQTHLMRSIPANRKKPAENRQKLARLLILSCLLAVVPAQAEFGWQTVTNDPPCQGLDETALTALNGKLYLIGGRGINPVEEYSPATGGWKKLSAPPMEMHHFQAVAVNGRIAVAGAMTGRFPHEKPLANIWWFDPGSNIWTKGEEIPADRRRGGGGTVVSGEKLYLVCGITNGHWNGFVSWADALDLKSGQWTRLPDAPHPRDHVQAALVDGKIVLAGGRTTYGEIMKVFDLTVPEVDVFDLSGGKWSTLPNNIPTARAGAMTAERDSEVFIIGGESMAQRQAHCEVEALNLATGKWKSLPMLNQGCHGTGAAFIGDRLYIASGVGNRGGAPKLKIMQKLIWPGPSKPHETSP